ncbi:Hsp20/alpha crystallin family protein [Taibaiella koreensis]|uniref:Hsp20/alpha crystallin family protein n=1 Tax=Taibaiella koreensis TaxID=1268548 RepID=UPI001968A6D4|nr:Hsp20/alpha crystallin family protein [Taibaiella koreensis]
MVRTNHFLPRTFNGLVEDIFNGNAARFFRDDAAHDEWIRNAYHVPVNVKENEAGYTLEVIAPGIAKEELKLQVNDKVLTLSFDHKENEQKEEGKWLRKEFKQRSFKRSFTLGDQVDTEKITAAYNNGILLLTLPKKEASIATNKVIDIL